MLTTLSGILDLPLEEKTKRGLLYTPAEIAQQPATWKTTLPDIQAAAGSYRSLSRYRWRAGIARESAVCHSNRRRDLGLYLAGAYLRSAPKWGCEVSPVASTDLLPNMEEYVIPGRHYLWISFSRSGDSPEGVAVLQQALKRYPEIAHLIVTCNEYAHIGRTLQRRRTCQRCRSGRCGQRPQPGDDQLLYKHDRLRSVSRACLVARRVRASARAAWYAPEINSLRRRLHWQRSSQPGTSRVSVFSAAEGLQALQRNLL